MSQRIRIFVARDPEENVAAAACSPNPEKAKSIAVDELIEAGYSADQCFWVVVDVPEYISTHPGRVEEEES